MLLTSILSDRDLYLFNEGSHERLYEKLGASLGKRIGPGHGFCRVGSQRQ